MSQKKDPATEVVAFFETTSLETAQTVLAICKGVLARRSPKKPTARPAKRAAPRATDVSGSQE